MDTVIWYKPSERGIAGRVCVANKKAVVYCGIKKSSLRSWW